MHEVGSLFSRSDKNLDYIYMLHLNKTLAVFSPIIFYLNAFCNDRNVSLFFMLTGVGRGRVVAVGCRFDHFDVF